MTTKWREWLACWLVVASAVLVGAFGARVLWAVLVLE